MALENPVKIAEEESKILRTKNGRIVKPSKSDIKKTAKAVYDKVAPVFEDTFGVNFAEALSKIPDVNLQYQTKSDRRRERRKHYRESKDSIENQMSETAFLRCYGSGMSIRAWNRNRTAQSFETKETAKEKNENASDKAKKSHVPASESIVWDKHALKEEFEGYEDGTTVNWSELARKYNVNNTVCFGESAQNGGQIIKDWLIIEGVNINRFKRLHDKGDNDSTDEGHIRRKKRRWRNNCSNRS